MYVACNVYNIFLIDALLMHHEIKRIIYKMMLDKTSKHTEYINRIMRRLVDDMSE